MSKPHILTLFGTLLQKANELHTLRLAARAKTAVTAALHTETVKATVDSRSYDDRMQDLKKWQQQ